jgi:hypothetical protein
MRPSSRSGTCRSDVSIYLNCVTMTEGTSGVREFLGQLGLDLTAFTTAPLQHWRQLGETPPRPEHKPRQEPSDWVGTGAFHCRVVELLQRIFQRAGERETAAASAAQALPDGT